MKKGGSTLDYLSPVASFSSKENPSKKTLPNPKVEIQWNRTISTYDFQGVSNVSKEYSADWNKKMKKDRKDWLKSCKTKNSRILEI
jgi:hypothetical protein